MIEYTGIDWVSARGATLAKMAETGHRLWVVEKLPPAGDWRGEVWEASAAKGKGAGHLVSQWTDARSFPLPRSREARAWAVEKLMANHAPLALVVHEADRLPAVAIKVLRLYSEAVVLVVLVGDVCQISCKTRQLPEFFQRAVFCVQAGEVFA